MHSYQKKSCLLILYFLIAHLQLLPAEEYVRSTMTVQGYAMLRKPADELQLDLGVISRAKTVNDALKMNNQKINRVIQELQDIGLARSEYQTSQFAIQPIYTTPPKNPPENWTATIDGYEVTNQINIQTSKLELAGSIIDRTTQMGTNSVDHISFNLKNRRAHQAEVLALATQYAIEDAQQLAQAAHVQLLRILSISLNQTHPFPQPRMAMYAFKSAEAADSSTSIIPGDVEISASVTITYEIH